MNTSYRNKLTKLSSLMLCAMFMAYGLSTGLATESTPLKLQYDQPAKDWKTEALPIGNGHLGGMIFGGIGEERIQFNEDSLWIGDEKDTGASQAFGDLYIGLDQEVALSCPSKQTSPNGQSVAAASDGDFKTKWCMEHQGKNAVWQIKYVTAPSEPLRGYAFTSASDAPSRDPRVWTLEGSNDGNEWTVLDEQKLDKPFEKRHMKQHFKFKNNKTYSSYRFTFKPLDKSHFQVAEIELDTNVAITNDETTQYRRELNIETAIHTTSYEQSGVTYQRESFASYPDQVMVLRFSASEKGAQSGTVRLTDAHTATITANGNTITSSGDLSKATPYKGKRQYDMFLDYAAQARVLHEGGKISVTGNGITFEKCDTVTILLAADTNYVNERAKGWREGDPVAKTSKELDAASKKTYEELRDAHIKDYQSLFNRMTLDLGSSTNASRNSSIVDRVKGFDGEHEGVSVDPEFEVLYFQLARYLMISCSRPGSLPANLQGLWIESNKPAWRGDYHTDVNLQMNYWFVDQTNISECFEPLAEYINSIRAVRRDETKEAFGTRGWMTHSENGVFGGSTYRWVPGDASWVAQNIWDHYAFTQDKEYLKKYAYPLLKELAEFWEDYLIEDPNGKLISQASQSPEHGPVVAGNSYDQQLAYDLFTNYMEASTILGIDEEFREKVKVLRSRLLGPKIGKWGQLQEWAKDIDDPKNKHRHLSHLIAVYPGRQITLLDDPKLAEAAKVSLNARGDAGAGWSISWKSSLWARLGDGNRAYRILRTKTRLHGDGVFKNLMSGVYNFFQIESHFGYAASVCEMLVQSHTGTIHLLPALPDAWPSGKVAGIRARGGVTVDMQWKDGVVVDYKLRSEKPKEVRLRINGEEKEVMTDALEK